MKLYNEDKSIVKPYEISIEEDGDGDITLYLRKPEDGSSDSFLRITPRGLETIPLDSQWDSKRNPFATRFVGDNDRVIVIMRS